MLMKLIGLASLAAAGAGVAVFAGAGAGGKPDAADAPKIAVQPGAVPAGTHPVAVELFTSQGCSSCPPADRIQAALEKDPRVVAITRPVTYWDQLGWKDTLALPANTDLQRAYAARRIPGAGVYTPQSVVQGTTGIVGGRGPAILQAIDQASRQPGPEVKIMAASTGGRAVALSGMANGDAVLSVVALKSGVDVAIGAGENGGRKVHYTNVLVDEHRVAKWRGGAARFDIPASAMRVNGADRYAVLLRQGDAGPILAARYL